MPINAKQRANHTAEKAENNIMACHLHKCNINLMLSRFRIEQKRQSYRIKTKGNKCGNDGRNRNECGCMNKWKWNYNMILEMTCVCVFEEGRKEKKRESNTKRVRIHKTKQNVSSIFSFSLFVSSVYGHAQTLQTSTFQLVSTNQTTSREKTGVCEVQNPSTAFLRFDHIYFLLYRTDKCFRLPWEIYEFILFDETLIQPIVDRRKHIFVLKVTRRSQGGQNKNRTEIL